MGWRWRRLALACAAVSLCFAAAGRSQEESAADATSVAAGDEDPLAWVGPHEVLFVARVREGGAVLRSGPDPNYRVVREVPGGHLLVAVGDAPGHLQVLVPDGYVAYIHSRYVKVDEEGVGVITNSRVNVRSLPSSQGDYPIGQVNAGEVVWVWGRKGEEDGWCEVTAPADLPLWAADADLEIAGDARQDPALLAQLEALRAERRKAWEERAGEAAERAAGRRQAEQALERVQEARTLLDAARQQGAAADCEPVKALLASILEGCSDSAVGLQVEALRRDIEMIEKLRDAVREREALLAQLAAERQRIEDERLAAAKAAKEEIYGGKLPEVGQEGAWNGFLRERADDREHPFALEQGTRVAAWLRCSSGRIRLADFAGQLVCVHGRVLSIAGAPLIEVGKLEIIRK
ncbi:MAG: SH3 domain-containing protein [Planctomycetes bacterium]|nr:SH3 domain-containing protein [Planctomycetota bacterium]